MKSLCYVIEGATCGGLNYPMKLASCPDYDVSSAVRRSPGLT